MTILVIGCGSIGRRHAGNLKQIAAGEILVFDPDLERAQTLAKACGATLCGSLEDSYARKPDAVVICAPTSLHLPLAKQAVAQGCHVFVEKPLSHSLAGIEDLLAEVQSRHVVLQVGYNLRFDPLMEQIRDAVRSGRIGRTLSARLHFGAYLPARHPWEDYHIGYGARSQLGGGVLLDSSHEIDYAMWLFGDPEAVYCAGGKYSSLELDVEDIVELTLSYPDKIVSIHLDYVQHPRQRRCDIIGSHGQLRGDLDARCLHVYEGGAAEFTACPPTHTFDEVYVKEIRHFLQRVTGGDATLEEAQSAVRTLVVAEEARLSMRSGRARQIDWASAGAGLVAANE
jgi:predicted dehydrogenase